MKADVTRMLDVAIVTLLGLVLSVGFTATARAECGPSTLDRPPNAKSVPLTSRVSARPVTVSSVHADKLQPEGADIVGMWRVKFVAKNSPPIPDGTVIDAGFAQWHGDGTEIMNSSRPPATGNICLGVWKKTGASTYRLNHKALDFDVAGNLIGQVTIREDVTVDHSGDSFSGTFTIDSYDNTGQMISHIAGDVTGQRVTVD